MISENFQLRAKAREQLKGNWTNPVLVVLVMMGIGVATGLLSILGSIASLIISGPLTVGMAYFALKFIRGEKPEVSAMFEGFKNFGATLGLYFWNVLWILLWMCLFVIPGIIKSFSYSMSFYIMADNPQVGVKEALNISKKIMEGYKGKLFILGLSFIGWVILCMLTCGIGLLWLIPYAQMTFANFYEELKAESMANGKFTLSAPGNTVSM